MPLDVEDKYCHQCGQLNSTKKLALKDFITEFVSNVFSYDGRGWRTIKHILFKPGFVSKQFLAGKRLSYANPFRFFLSVCIVFFIMVQLQQSFEKYFGAESTKIIDANTQNDTTVEDITEEQLEEIEDQQFAGKFVADKIREEQSNQKLDKQKDTIPSKSNIYYTQKELDDKSWYIGVFQQLDDYTDYYRNEREPDTEIALNNLGHRLSNYNKALYEKSILLESIENDGSKLTDLVLPKLPVFLFLFTPFVTLFIWLLYSRRPFNYMEHLIFLFNIMTFIFLSCIILLLVKWISIGYINLSKPFFLALGPIYFYKALRNFYRQRRLKTVIKFLLISFVYSISFIFGFVLLLFLGIAFY